MDFSKRPFLVNAFFSSQFNYCPLTWMCHNRMLINRTNRLHEMCFRIICNDKHTSFEELLEKDMSVSKRQKNLQVLRTEMFKIYRETSPEITQDIFSIREQGHHNLRNISDYIIPKVQSVNFGFESIRYLGPKI